MGIPKSNSSKSNIDYCKKYCEKNKEELKKKDRECKKLQENMKSIYTLKSINNFSRKIESDPENIEVEKKLNRV